MEKKPSEHRKDTGDSFILRQLKDNDEKALELLFDKYYKYLVVTSYNIIQDNEQAKDIVQDVFFNLWTKRQQLDIEQFKPYLRRAVYNKSIDVLRKLKRQGWTEEISEINDPVDSLDPHRQLESSEIQLAINKAIDLLPERCKMIFCLSRLENKKHKEIAEELNISVKTIENQMTKALKIIRSALSGKEYILFLIACSLTYLKHMTLL